MKTHYPEYEALIRERLTPKRYRHSLNVMERAVELAGIFGADPCKAELAGLLHDAEKSTDPKILLQSLEKSDILLSDADRDFSDIRKVRKLSEQDLDAALLYSLQFILGDLVAQGQPLQQDSLACYNQLALKKAFRAGDPGGKANVRAGAER